MHYCPEPRSSINLLWLNTDHTATSAAFTDSSDAGILSNKVIQYRFADNQPNKLSSCSLMDPKGSWQGRCPHSTRFYNLWNLRWYFSASNPPSSQLATKAKKRGKKSTKITEGFNLPPPPHNLSFCINQFDLILSIIENTKTSAIYASTVSVFFFSDPQSYIVIAHRTIKQGTTTKQVPRDPLSPEQRFQNRVMRKACKSSSWEPRYTRHDTKSVKSLRWK